MSSLGSDEKKRNNDSKQYQHISYINIEEALNTFHSGYAEKKKKEREMKIIRNSNSKKKNQNRRYQIERVHSLPDFNESEEIKRVKNKLYLALSNINKELNVKIDNKEQSKIPYNLLSKFINNSKSTNREEINETNNEDGYSRKQSKKLVLDPFIEHLNKKNKSRERTQSFEKLINDLSLTSSKDDSYSKSKSREKKYKENERIRSHSGSNSKQKILVSELSEEEVDLYNDLICNDVLSEFAVNSRVENTKENIYPGALPPTRHSQ